MQPELMQSGPRRVRCGAFACRIGWLSWMAMSCWAPEEQRLSCDDLLTPGAVSYAVLQAQVSGQGEKGCAFPACHGSEVANHGIRFDDPNGAYDALTTRIQDIYGQVASGRMPRGGTRWDAGDLQLLRSWYCDGSFPAP